MKIYFNPLIGPKQAISIWLREELGVMALKGYSTFPKDPELEPQHQMQFSVIPRTLVGGVLHFCKDAANSSVFDKNIWYITASKTHKKQQHKKCKYKRTMYVIP